MTDDRPQARYQLITDDWILFRQCYDSQEAQVLKSFLQAHGVDAHISGEGMSLVQPVAVQPAVFVRATDRFRANGLLKDRGILPDGRADGQVRAPERVPESEVFCPSCGSHWLDPVTDTVSTRLPFIRLSPNAGDRWYKCRLCGTTFDDSLDRTNGLLLGLGWAVLIAAVTFGVIQLIIWLKLVL